MESRNTNRAERFLREKKNHKRWLGIFLCLAGMAAVLTVSVLMSPGQALSHKEKVLKCEYKVHKHTEKCYNAEKELVCGYADYVVHVHNDDCYDREGNLVCQLPEIEEHKHTDECYKDEKVLVCGKEESKGHEHTDECYQEEKTLTCGKEEHTHGDACYDGNGELTCGKEEHTHGDDCYQTEKVLVCEQEDGEGHTHTDDCYQTERVLACGKLELHTHTDACYKKVDGEKVLTCKIPVLEEHVHSNANNCFRIVEISDEEAKSLFTQTADDSVIDTDNDETNADADESEAENDVIAPIAGNSSVDGLTVPSNKTSDSEDVDKPEAIALEVPAGSGITNANVKCNDNGNVELGETYSYSFDFEPGPEEWKIDLPFTIQPSEMEPQSIKAVIMEEDENGNKTEKEIEIGTVVVKDGKIVYTPSADLPEGFDFSDIEKFNVTVPFTVTATSNLGLELPGLAKKIGFEPRDLAPFVTDAKLTQGNREIEGNDKVVVGETYHYSVHFKEGTSLKEQFSTPMYFDLPQNVKCEPVDHMEFKDDDGSLAGYYSVDEKGHVTVVFYDDYLAAKEGLDMNLGFDMTVADTSENGMDLPWGKNGEKKNFDIDIKPDAKLTKTGGTYNPTDEQGPCIDYTVELEITKGAVKNPQITDTMHEGLSYRQDSGIVIVYDEEGNVVEMDPAPKLVETADGWKVEGLPETLSKGQRVVVQYTSDIDLSKMSGNPDKGNFSFTAENDAKFNADFPVGDDKIERTDNEKIPCVDRRLEKNGKKDTSDPTKYPSDIDWEILVGSGSMDVRGYTVKDELEGKHQINKERPLEVKWKDAGGNTIQTYYIPWDELGKYGLVPKTEGGKIVGFEFTIPTEEMEYKDGTFFWQGAEGDPDRVWEDGDWIKLEYYTTYEESGGECSNKANVTMDEDTFVGEDSIGIGAGTINKEGKISEDGQYMEYTVTIDVPDKDTLANSTGGYPSDKEEQKLSRFYIIDQLEFADIKMKDENDQDYYVRYFVDNTPVNIELNVVTENGVEIPFTEDPDFTATEGYTYHIKENGVDHENLPAEKSVRQFEIWFNTYLEGKEPSELDHSTSYWTLTEPSTITITYKIPLDAGLVLEDPQYDGHYQKTDLTVRDLFDEGRTLTNEVTAHGRSSNEFGAKHKYTPTQPEFGTKKDAEIVNDENGDQVIEYRVRFNGFTTDAVTGKLGPVTIDPTTFKLEDQFDSRLEYVPGSLYVEVYAPDSMRLRYRFRYAEGEDQFNKPVIVENGDGTTTMTAEAMKFNYRFYQGTTGDDKNNLEDYLWSSSSHTLKDRDALYIFVYKLRLKNENVTGEELTLNNKATVHYNGDSSNDDATVNFMPDILDKTGKQILIPVDGGLNNKMEYVIDVNPGGADMVTTEKPEYNPGNYTLTDKMDDILSLDSESVHVYGIYGEAPNETEVEFERVAEQGEVKVGSQKFVLQEQGGNSFKLILPDEVHIRIVYNATLDAGYGKTGTVSNSVEMEGGMKIEDSSSAEYNVGGTDAGIRGSQAARLFKKDASSGNYMSGATFTVYTPGSAEDGKLAISEDAKWETVKPDAIIGDSIKQKKDYEGYYVLVETEAPEGYVLDSRPTVFKFGDPPEGDVEKVTVTYNGETYSDIEVKYIRSGNLVIVIDNTPVTYELPESGGLGNTKPYTVGALLALAAISILLYTTQKRRKEGN